MVEYETELFNPELEPSKDFCDMEAESTNVDKHVLPDEFVTRGGDNFGKGEEVTDEDDTADYCLQSWTWVKS